MKSFYTIMEQVAPPPEKGCRYRLVENFMTIDGVRSRLTNFVADDLTVLRNLVTDIENGVLPSEPSQEPSPKDRHIGDGIPVEVKRRPIGALAPAAVTFKVQDSRPQTPPSPTVYTIGRFTVERDGDNYNVFDGTVMLGSFNSIEAARAQAQLRFQNGVTKHG